MKRAPLPPAFYWFAAVMFLVLAAIPAYWVMRAQTDGVISGYHRYSPSPVYVQKTEPEAFARAVRLWKGVCILDLVFGMGCAWKASALSRRDSSD